MPSVAIHEGVFKSLQITGEHFGSFVFKNDKNEVLDILYIASSFNSKKDFDSNSYYLYDSNGQDVQMKQEIFSSDDGTKQMTFKIYKSYYNNNIQYIVKAGDVNYGQRNYFINVVKKQKGAKLFVNGPDERQILFGLPKTEEIGYEDYHDIFMANIGDEPLKNIKVTLENPQNVKLDDYWTIGNNGNNTLAKFEVTSSAAIYVDISEDAELFNVGKIRIIPNGEGSVSGTIRVSADGQEDKLIKLVHLKTPEIITERIPAEGQSLDPVKYALFQE